MIDRDIIMKNDLVKLNERALFLARQNFADWYENIPGEVEEETFLVLETHKDQHGEVSKMKVYEASTQKVHTLYREDVEKLNK